MIIQNIIIISSSRRIRWSSTTMAMGVLLLLLVSMTIASHSIIAADADAADTADTDPGTTAATTTTTTVVACRHVVMSIIIRKFVRPYLPPPIIKLLKVTDEFVNSRLQEPEDEPSILLLLTLVAAYLIYKILAFVTASLFGSSDSSSSSSATTSSTSRTKKTRKVQQRQRPYDRNVILVGPSLGGKTSIFNYLVQQQQTQRQNQQQQPKQQKQHTFTTNTVRSLQSTTAYVNINKNNNSKGSVVSVVVKVIDTPGVWKPPQQIHVDDGSDNDGSGGRSGILYLVVLDSTKALSKEAVDVVYELFTTERLGGNAADSSRKKKNKVMIVCHKSHAPHAKNPRRIKLQLRNELQKLSKLRGDNSDSDSNSNSNSNSYWEDVMDNQVVFGSSDCTTTTTNTNTGIGIGKKEKSDNMDNVDMDEVVEFISSSSSS